MIKECKVILRNELVMVVLFDGKEIQITSDKQNTTTVFVKLEKGKYSIVSKDEFDRYEKSNKKPKRQIVETKEEKIDESIAIDNEE